MPGSNPTQTGCAFFLQTGCHCIKLPALQYLTIVNMQEVTQSYKASQNSEIHVQSQEKLLGTQVAARLDPGIVEGAGQLDVIVKLMHSVEPGGASYLSQNKPVHKHLRSLGQGECIPLLVPVVRINNLRRAVRQDKPATIIRCASDGNCELLFAVVKQHQVSPSAQFGSSLNETCLLFVASV